MLFDNTEAENLMMVSRSIGASDEFPLSLRSSSYIRWCRAIIFSSVICSQVILFFNYLSFPNAFPCDLSCAAIGIGRFRH